MISASSQLYRLSLWFALVLAFLPRLVDGQSIQTIAGGGTDDGKQATAVSLFDPSGIAIDTSGNVYIAERRDGRVVKVTRTTGTISTVAGNGSSGFSGDGGPATAAGLREPVAVAVDQGGNIFIADARNQRIRKVAAESGNISTVAGSGQGRYCGDGGPATAACLNWPSGLAFDGEGNLLIADQENHRIRKVTSTSGDISTVAGNGDAGFTGDRAPATAAGLSRPAGVAVDRSGDIFVADTDNKRIRRIAAATGVITTVLDESDWLLAPVGVAIDPIGNIFVADFQNGLFRIDARTGIRGHISDLKGAASVVADPAGNVYVAEANGGLVSRIAAGTGMISTVAGNGEWRDVGDMGPATQARLWHPQGVAADHNGDIYIADTHNSLIRKVSAATSHISTIAGGGYLPEPGGDSIPATSAALSAPVSLAVDAAGHVYLDDFASVRKVDQKNGLISWAAGNGVRMSDVYAFSGDGGPATLASLSTLQGLAVDAADNIYVSASNRRVRKVSSVTGVIETVAGNGNLTPLGDGGPATAAALRYPAGLALNPAGDLYVADVWNHILRRVDRKTGTINTIAGGAGGQGPFGTWGDGGPASTASLLSPSGVALDTRGDVYIADSSHNAIRKIAASTGSISTVVGDGRAEFGGDSGPAAAARLSGAYGVATDPAGNLYIADTYNNRIRAVFACRDRLGTFDSSYPNDGAIASTNGLGLSWSRAESAFRYDVLVDTEFPPKKILQQDVTGQAFQISGLEPGKTYFWQVRAKGDPYCPAVERSSGLRRFTTVAPCSPPSAPMPVSATVTGATAALVFQMVPGASSYDLFLGTGESTALVASGLTSSSFTAPTLSPGTTYRWSVVAHASCDANLVSGSAESTFSVPGDCTSPPPAEISSPSGEAAVSGSAFDLTWQPSPGAASYDVFLGTGSDPPLFASGLTTSSLPITLDQGTTYSARVVAHAACDMGRTSSSPLHRFSTSPGAACPEPPAPTRLSTSKRSAFLGSTYSVSWQPVPGATSYRVERTGGASPASFTTSESSLILRASEKAAYSHRVTALTRCGSSSSPSSAVAVSVASAPPFVTVANPPKATVIRQPAPGLPLPRLEVEVRNTGPSDFVGFFNTSQPIPFFIMSETAISLRAGEIRIFYLQFSGVPMDQPGVYDGLLTLQASDPADSTAFPQISIALNVTGLKPADPIPSTTPPVFLQEGAPVESVRFIPALDGAQPPAILVDLKNPGATPVDLAADVLPESWFSISDASSASKWNATPIPPGATRTLRLTAQRIRGGSGGAFPRYAYLTVRSVDGTSSRLLVQDSAVIAAGPCPGRSVLGPGRQSFIVPSLVNAPARTGGRYVSQLLLTNLGPDALQADLYYTPDSLEPPVSGFDCKRVLFASVVVPGNDVVALTDPVGQVFGLAQSSGLLEVRSSQIGQLRVQSIVDAPAPGGGSFGFQLPVVKNGDGARQNVPHAVIGVMQSDVYRTNLILSETSGQHSSVTVTLFDKSGTPLGSTDRVLLPYTKRQFSISELAPPGATLTAGALEIVANPGSAGSVAGVITVIDGRTGDASSFLARPLTNATASTSYAIPSVVVSTTFKSRLEIRNNGVTPATYKLHYLGNTGPLTSTTRALTPKGEDSWESVLEGVFNLAAGSYGPLFIESDSPNLSIVSRVYSEQPTGSYGDAIEAYALDDAGSTGESGRMILTDGLEGTDGNDRSRGARSNLIITEIGGGTVELEVSIWEKTQARVAPAGTLIVSLGPNQQRQINDIFGDAGFGVGHKDRLNVLCTIRPNTASTGRAVALVTRIDNKTLDTKNLVLRP